MYRVYSFPRKAVQLQIRTVRSFETPRAHYTVSLPRKREFSATPLFKPINSHNRCITLTHLHAMLCFWCLPWYPVFYIWFLRMYVSRVRVGSSCFLIREVLITNFDAKAYDTDWGFFDRPHSVQESVWITGLTEIRLWSILSTSVINHSSLFCLRIFFLSFFLFWLFLHNHCGCRGLLLHLITHNDTKTIPLDEWSAHRRNFYLTTHNTHTRQTSMPPAGFESTIFQGTNFPGVQLRIRLHLTLKFQFFFQL